MHRSGLLPDPPQRARIRAQTSQQALPGLEPPGGRVGGNVPGQFAASEADYTSAIKIYDSKGASHDISIYFDRTSEDNQWEFLVTCDPSEDLRVLTTEELDIYNPDTLYNYENHKGAGALLYGIIQFDTSGNLKADVVDTSELATGAVSNIFLLEFTYLRQCLCKPSGSILIASW